jgi:hypothetical protein
MFSLSIRLPEEMYQWIKEKAEKENRSLNGQINYLLGQLKRQEERDDLSTERRGDN